MKAYNGQIYGLWCFCSINKSPTAIIDLRFRRNQTDRRRFWKFNSHAVAMFLKGNCPFMSFFRLFLITEYSRGKIVIPLTYIFTSFISLKFFSLISFHWEKNHLSQAVLWISPKNRIPAAVKVWNGSLKPIGNNEEAFED